MSQNVEDPKFVSPHEWDGFCRYLLTRNRYVLNGRWDRFIKTILLTAKKRELILEKEKVLFRARIGNDEREYEDEEGNYDISIEPLSPRDIGAPPDGKAIEGRINPRGISYLYLASDIETAISEVKPLLKQNVSVGNFSLRRGISVIDVSKDKWRHYISSEDIINEPSEKWEPCIWGDINLSFSLPVRVGEEHNQYIPTQYLSECFKNIGYDGIVYKSSFTKEGYNLALFNPKIARLLGAQLFNVKSIAYQYEECANPYFLKHES